MKRDPNAKILTKTIMLVARGEFSRPPDQGEEVSKRRGETASIERSKPSPKIPKVAG